MIYLDNAATTLKKPPEVIKTVNDCIKKYCANPGRSSHALSIKISEMIYETREKIARFCSARSPECVVFTQNATHALNIAIKTSLFTGDHAIISDLEHNAIVRPLYALSKKNGVEYSIFSTKGNIEENISKLVKPNTKYIISTLASNVTGKEIPIELLSSVSKKHGLSLILDASQLIGHKEINLKNFPCDILCAPGHKGLFGIQGAGFIIFNDEKKRETIFEGGSGTESFNYEMPVMLPERFEAGTLPSPSIISISKGIEFIERTGIKSIFERLTSLSDRVAERILSLKSGVLYEYGNGVVSFNLSGFRASEVAEYLDKKSICTRAGFHCAPLAHKTIGTEHIGTVRISLSYFNTYAEIDKLYKAIKDIEKTKV